MDLVLQLLVVGIAQAAIYALVAMGFGLILAVSDIFHFAHAAVFALAGFLTYAFIMQMGLPFWAGFPLAVIATVLVGLAIQFFIYWPLKKRQAAGRFSLVLASIGIEYLIENAIGLYWGTGGSYLDNPFASITFSFGNTVITLTDLLTFLLAVFGYAGTMLFLRYTATGRAMMAYADNPTMAAVVGISPKRVGAAAMTIACILVTPAAVATGWYSSLLPNMGLTPLLYSIAAVVIGGIGSVSGAFFAAFLLGLLSSMISVTFSGFWADTFAFIIMMVVIVWLPGGLLGTLSVARSAR